MQNIIKKIRYKSLLVIVMLLLMIGYLLNKIYFAREVTSETTKPLDFSYTWYGSESLYQTTIELTQDVIYSSSMVDSDLKPSSDGYVDLIISKEEYPKLFTQGESNTSLINISQLKGIKDRYDGNLIMLSNNQPSHGEDSPTYAIIISSFEGKVVFETPDYFSRTIFPSIDNYPQENYLRMTFETYAMDYCNSCNLNFLEVYEYDRINSRMVLVNNRHRDEFVRYLNQYKEIEITGCYYQGQKRNFTEIRKISGDSAKCESSSDITNKLNNPLTVGKFYQILDNLQKIVNGENITMYE